MTQGRATDVVIIGAGLAGLMAGRVLADAGKRVLLLDQGSHVGGRLATRQIGGGAADYGAQFFTVRDPEFSAFVSRWLAEGIVFEWSRGMERWQLEHNPRRSSALRGSRRHERACSAVGTELEYAG